MQHFFVVLLSINWKIHFTHYYKYPYLPQHHIQVPLHFVNIKKLFSCLSNMKKFKRISKVPIFFNLIKSFFLKSKTFFIVESTKFLKAAEHRGKFVTNVLMKYLIISWGIFNISMVLSYIVSYIKFDHVTVEHLYYLFLCV